VSDFDLGAFSGRKLMPFFEWSDHRLFYCQNGNGSLLLILPGNTASSTAQQGELDYFSDRFHVASLDFLGTGQSDRVAVWADQWWLQGARQAVALVEHLGYEQAIFMGASGGGVASLLAAIHFPLRVRAVVADSFVETVPPNFFRKRVIDDRAHRSPDQIAFWQYNHGADWEQVVAADTVMLERFADQGADWFQGQLGKIQCPVLLTASLKDTMLYQPARQYAQMAETISDCRVYLHHEGGHPMMWTAPEAFRAVSDYLLRSL
jgi:valacyclovir hydrolase